MAKKISDTAKKALRAKANKSKKYTLTDLQKVYRRGQGAYLGSGSRPGVSMAAWAMARVNSFMRGSKKHDLDLQAKARKRNRKKK
jgi:hypothetical protein|tara:strand:+ start:947 stop:1201 length:255 start_codon:yes stop_codon:yes gene_type:complete